MLARGVRLLWIASIPILAAQAADLANQTNSDRQVTFIESSYVVAHDTHHFGRVEGPHISLLYEPEHTLGAICIEELAESAAPQEERGVLIEQTNFSQCADI